MSRSKCSAETLRRAAKEAQIDFVEVEYSPWELVMERNGVLDACKELGIKVLAYSPLGRGFLTGWVRTAHFRHGKGAVGLVRERPRDR